MFTSGKSVLACASILFALAAQTSAHAIPSPALGVKGAPARSDVQRPSTAKPCGNIDPATTLDTSTAIPVAADGTVTMSVVNFNAGADGSTSVAVSVDATGKGTSFVAGTVTTNGNPAPNAVETDKVVFSLPAGTKCTGGTAGNLCLVSVKTTAGFGACTVVSQGAAAAAPPAAGTAVTSSVAAVSTVAAAGAGQAAAGTTTTTTTGKKAKGAKKGKGKAAKAAAKAAKAKAAAAGVAAAPVAPAPVVAAAVPKNKKVGTRAARALRRELFGAAVERRGAALD
jgi:hypothetical protein